MAGVELDYFRGERCSLTGFPFSNLAFRNVRVIFDVAISFYYLREVDLTGFSFS